VTSSIKAEVSAVCWSGAFRCVTTMPWRKDICNDLREGIVAAHQSGKSYKAISKQSGVHHSTVKPFSHWLKKIKNC